MEENNKLSVSQVLETVLLTREGKYKSTKPIIIWFDENVSGDILEFVMPGDRWGLGNAISSAFNDVLFWSSLGSPMGNVGSKKIYIHAPYDFSCHKPEILPSIEYGRKIFQELEIPVFLFYPLKSKDNLLSYLQGYDQFFCIDSPENVKERWLERVSSKGDDGKQIVDNFYLEFLRSAPMEFIDRSLAPQTIKHPLEGNIYQYWERASSNLRRGLKSIVMIGDSEFQEPSEEQVSTYRSFYSDGNIDLTRIDTYLNSLPERTWDIWYEENKSSINPFLTGSNDRLKAFITYLCNDFNIVGNISDEARVGLLKFHRVI